ncbi:hypothetical protein NSK11_contig00160-0010 [Nocardia seriolae]|uniref:Uncharacterized protein n=1 Tax=Nocardia seriolae TaxID=37332 RepID=A0ABC9Z4B8_9NOCA|nr:hypothetical protein NSERKGN1266_18570 [Nocardia seriolae]BEK98154.1 hypothetical protein NSER024013_60600 [Nocardia seriolae]GAM50517.1 hypothetical protein NS07_v2contig00157-0011 [Nocardia seriolae]GAP32469.1 hypothetical protein NSK11_contig00160-0010 [Nocardia seriolae]GEM28037.1 hypothetical protein NS2_62760 [Nocardia seriolae NBRC 15557]
MLKVIDGGADSNNDGAASREAPGTCCGAGHRYWFGYSGPATTAVGIRVG